MIKLATIEDLEILNLLNKEVQDIHHKLSPKKFKAHHQADMKSLFSKFINAETAFILMYYYENKPVAYLIYEIRKSKETDFTFAYSFIYIHHIAVLKEFQNKGIALELINLVKYKARELKIETIELDVWTKNERAKNYFRKIGFETYNEKMELRLN